MNGDRSQLIFNRKTFSIDLVEKVEPALGCYPSRPRKMRAIKLKPKIYCPICGKDYVKKHKCKG